MGDSQVLLRRIREHATSHNWFAVAIDLVIVVLGVFLGIQVNNWNQARIASDTGRIYRERLIADLRFNEVDMERRAAYFTQVQRFGEAALAALDGSSLALSDEEFIVAAYQATQITPRPFDRHTYDELLATGQINLIGSIALRDKVARFYLNAAASDETFMNKTPYREIMRRAIPYLVQQRIRANCAETRELDSQGSVINRLPEHCTLNLPRQQLASAAARLRAIPELDQDLTRTLGDIDQKLTLFRANRDRARGLEREIEAEND